MKKLLGTLLLLAGMGCSQQTMIIESPKEKKCSTILPSEVFGIPFKKSYILGRNDSVYDFFTYYLNNKDFRDAEDWHLARRIFGVSSCKTGIQGNSGIYCTSTNGNFERERTIASKKAKTILKFHFRNEHGGIRTYLSPEFKFINDNICSKVNSKFEIYNDLYKKEYPNESN